MPWWVSFWGYGGDNTWVEDGDGIGVGRREGERVSDWVPQLTHREAICSIIIIYFGPEMRYISITKNIDFLFNFMHG